MAVSRLEGIMLNRMLVLAQIILIPIYFIFFSIRWRSSLALFFENLVANVPFMARILPSWLIWFEVNLGIPIFFSLPWILFSVFRATRIADSYELMGRALGKVRIDQKLFYGLNAGFALIFLIFPFFSPIITIFGLIWGIRLVMRKAIIGRISRIFWLIPAIVLSLIPGLIAMAFYSNYIELFQQILTIWRNAVPNLFGIGLTLAIAISIGNFMLFMFEGSVKYGDMKEIPYGIVLVVKIFLFTILMIIWFNTLPPHMFVNFVNYFAVGLGFFELVMRRVRDLPNEDGTASGIVMVIAFSIVNIIINLLREFTNLTQVIQTIAIVLSALIFFILFYLSYSYAEEEFGPYGGLNEEKKKSKEKSTMLKDKEDVEEGS